MLMALLYTDEDCIAAAAPACDQVPFGDRYWEEFHMSSVDSGDAFETAYVTIANPEMRERLLMLGIDETIDGRELAAELERRMIPPYLPKAA
ncbi:MAG: hypothetical protein AAF456_20560 [Planctomycetota bacterium]